MKKLLLLILPFLYLSCDKIPSGTVDYSSGENISVGIGAPEVVVFNQLDSSVTINLKKSGTTLISEVWVEIYNPNEDLVNKNNLFLLDNGILANGDSTLNDNVYSVKFLLSRYNINGKYRIEYFIKYSDGKVWKAAYHNFTYYNGQQNYPPIISNLVMPDTIGTGLANVFLMSLKCFDPNGQEDIKDVFLKFVRLENGTTSSLVSMYDDGTHGDKIPGDGIYSFDNYFLAETSGKTRQFIFQAKDQSDSLSNIITHYIYVK